MIDQVKTYFYQIRKTDHLIQRLTNVVSALRSNLTNIGNELKPDKILSSKTPDTISATIAKIIDLENDIDGRIDELIGMKQKAFELICKIPDLDQQNVLIGRYVQMKDWDDIAIELNFSTQWVYRLHGKGLQAIAEFFQEDSIIE